MTQAFVCPFWSRRVASLGKMPECWDGVSEDSGGREVTREAGACSVSVRRCFCLQLAHPGGVTGQDQRVLGFLVALVICVAARKCCGSAGEDGED